MTSVSANTFSGSGAALTSINASNITSGTLSISLGGIGTTTLSANQILIGYSNTSILQSANLTWNNTSNTLSATNYIGSGSGLTNINVGGVQVFPANSQTDTSYLQNNITTAYTEHYTFNYNNFNANNYIGNYANSYVYDENSFLLANNVFQGSTYRNNTFGDMCYNNSFDDDCWNNTIGNYFYNNITDDDFDGNVIGNWFNNNRITANFQYNRIGENFQSNYLFQNSFYRNNIMNYFEDNIISGNDFQNNEIDNLYFYNKIN
jgi:hypothetical protein